MNTEPKRSLGEVPTRAWFATGFTCDVEVSPPRVAGPASVGRSKSASLPERLPLPGRVTRTRRRDGAALDSWIYEPAHRGVPSGTLVSVHGVSRQVQGQLSAWAPWAERLGLTLVAPLFGRKAFRGYQRLEATASAPTGAGVGEVDPLGRGGRACPGPGPGRFGCDEAEAAGIPADRALLELLEQLRRDGRIGWGPVFLFGYSGGAQFVHRFLLSHPAAADGAIVAAAGFYTFPDRMTPYPYGLASRGGSRTFGVDAFLRKPLLVAVGNEDVQRDRQLRRRAWVDAWQGPNRVERAVRWTAALQREARRRGIEVSIALHRLPGAGHSFSQCMRAGLNWHAGMFLADQLERWENPGG